MSPPDLPAAAACLAALLLASGASAAAPPTSGEIAASLRLRGAQVTVAGLVRTERWEAVTERMATGDPRWIALAPALATSSDGAFSEGLGIGLAYALPKSPGAVLAALDLKGGPVVGAGQVCSLPFIEDTVRDRPAYKRRALRAVAGVIDPALSRARGACLAVLKRSS